MSVLTFRSEYSFRVASGTLDECLARLPGEVVALADTNGTWGHLAFAEAAKKAGKIPAFGVELAIVEDTEAPPKRSDPVGSVSLVALNEDGLRKLYRATSAATGRSFDSRPRVDLPGLRALLREPGEVVVIFHPSSWLPIEALSAALEGDEALRASSFVGLSPGSLRAPYGRCREDLDLQPVPIAENFFPTKGDSTIHELIMGRLHHKSRHGIGHIPSREELTQLFGEEYLLAEAILAKISSRISPIEFPPGEMVTPKVEKSLREMCVDGAKARGLSLDSQYLARLDYELDIIERKKFEPYFYVVAEMVHWAKERMFVGPARGSSCGSLVCYLLGITGIDPIPFDLLFERFIDMNRIDYPDIDIDFADDRRDLVFGHLEDLYGRENVTRIGTVSRLGPKSCLAAASKAMRIPAFRTAEIRNSMIERSSGDSRANRQLEDTFALDVGKEFLREFPDMALAGELEGRASHSGVHAAGILVTGRPVGDYASIDERTRTAQLDKNEAEALGLLKIDALGLRTLSVLQDCLDSIGKEREELEAWPLDDARAFDVLNRGLYWGVFQFEGGALQSLCRQFELANFEDIAAVGALARPGPLVSGGAQKWIDRRTGREEPTPIHESIEEITRVTMGVVIYQEQVLRIVREIGKLDWEDTNVLRKAMSKSKGKEFFDAFWIRFRKGAEENGVGEENAKEIWDSINTMGSWAFNRSHAIAYGTMSYWCAVLKAIAPLEFYTACLRHSKGEENSKHILRELRKQDIGYTPFDPELSEANWTCDKDNNRVVGGYLNIKGVGPKRAEAFARRKASGEGFNKAQLRLLETAKTPFDVVFEAEKKFKKFYDDPSSILPPREEVMVKGQRIKPAAVFTRLEDIAEGAGSFIVIARLVARKTRDKNELILIERRGGQRWEETKYGDERRTAYLNLVFEDDTGAINGTVTVDDFDRLAPKFIEEFNLGDWLLVYARQWGDFRYLVVEKADRIDENGVIRADRERFEAENPAEA